MTTAGRPSTDRVRCVTYLYSQEWVKSLATAFDEVWIMLTIRGSAWDWTKEPMPDHVRFVSDFDASDLTCSVVPVDDKKDGIDQDVFQFFKSVLESRKLPLVVCPMSPEVAKTIPDLPVPSLVHGATEDLRAARAWATRARIDFPSPPPPPLLKQRWKLSSHPAWMRHGRMMEHLIGNEFQGTIVELNCGDGALVSALRARLGGAKIIGYCHRLEEKKIAMSVESDLDIRLGEPSEAEGADVLVSSDLSWDLAPSVCEVATKKAKQKVVLAFNKQDHDLPPPWLIRDTLPCGPWVLHETLSHYYVVHEQAGAA